MHIFQAFDTEKKVMYTPDVLHAMGIMLCPNGMLFRIGSKIPLKVLFFSGKSDNGGRPLFEGDICKVGLQFDPTMPMLVEKWAVMRWVNETSQFIFRIPAPTGQEMTYMNIRECYWQGNEYTEPELLNKVFE